MGKIIKCEIKELPKLFVVGKELLINMQEHKTNNRMGGFWQDCFADGTLSTLEEQADFVFEDAYVGFMADWDKVDGNFVYVVGMLLKEGFILPEGFVARELPSQSVAIGWIQGKDTADVCAPAHELTEKALTEQGYTSQGMAWCMEYYGCPRFTTPNENGEIILDYYIPCKKVNA